VHTLVALAFHGEPPGPIGSGWDDWQVEHIDDDKQNNRPGNLEWVTRDENWRRAEEAGLIRSSADEETWTRAKAMKDAGANCNEIALALGLNRGAVWFWFHRSTRPRHVREEPEAYA